MKKLIKLSIKNFLSLPKTIFFNIRAFSFLEALNLPVWVHYSVKIEGLTRGKIYIKNSKIETGMIQIGFNSVKGVGNKKNGYIYLGDSSQLVFGGICNINKGVCAYIYEHANVYLGEKTYINDNFTLFSKKSITIKENVLIGWGVTIRDTDGHSIMCEEQLYNPSKEVFIDRHVWICSEAVILKGASLKNDSVLAQRSVTSKSYDESNIIIAGNPAKIIKRNINWEK